MWVVYYFCIGSYVVRAIKDYEAKSYHLSYTANYFILIISSQKEPCVCNFIAAVVYNKQ